MSACETVRGQTLDVDAALDSGRLGSFHWIVGLLCAGILFVDGYNVSVLNYVAPLLSKSLHVSRAALGPVLSASMFGNIVGFLALPIVSHRLGEKRTAVAAVALFALAEIAAALSGSVPGLIALRFVAGIALAAAMVCAVTLTGGYFPLRWRSSAVTYVFLGYTTGHLAAGGATHTLLALGFGWQAPIVFGGLLSLAYSAVLVRWLPDSLEYLVNRSATPATALPILRRAAQVEPPAGTVLTAGRKAQRASVGDLFEGARATTTALFWFTAVMSFGVVSILNSWITTLLVDAGLAMTAAVGVSVFFNAAGVLAGLTIGPAMDRIGPFAVMIGLFVGCAAAASVLGLVLPTRAVAALGVAAFVQGYCTSGLSKGMQAMGVYLYPSALRPAGLGWMLGIGRFGGAAGPVAAGLLLQAGWRPEALFQVLAGPLLLGAGALLLALRLRRRAYPSSDAV